MFPAEHSFASIPPKQLNVTGRVLVVEDNVQLARAYMRLLSMSGLTVEVAHDGASAARIIQNHDFDLVVSDIGLPSLNGIELLKIVRGHSLDIPVVLITANPSMESALICMEHGAFRYLLKPINLTDFRKVVEEGLRVGRLAKAQRIAWEDSTMRSAEAASNRDELDANFSSALQGLWMAYQPIVLPHNQKIFAYEALMRSREPVFPHPGALLDAAERLDRRHDLGRAVRTLVADDLDRLPWKDHLAFVNLLTNDLLDDELYLPDAPLNRHAHRVVLELTERTSLEDIKDIRQRVTRLRKLGFRIAIDDLGAGYAGLTSFAHLNPDIVKLDMTLIRDIQLDETKQRVVQNMVSFCEEMNILVVGEGVETESEKSMLLALGCTLHQGYFYAKPSTPFVNVTW